MFVLFSVAAALWGLVLFRQRKQAHRLHYLMMVLVGFKALTLLSQAGMYHLIRTTGHPEGWNVAFYVFNFLRGILFFTVGAADSAPSHATACTISPSTDVWSCTIMLNGLIGCRLLCWLGLVGAT